MISIWQLLFIIVIIALIWLYQRRPTGRRAVSRRRPLAFRETVRCVHCGTFVPRNQAVEEARNWYCCEEHRRLGAPRHPPKR